MAGEEKEYRSDLPWMPDRIKALPVYRGYPVPWFVAFYEGVPDFRIADAQKLHEFIRSYKRGVGLCWVCGQTMGKYLTFAIGPMCAINRISSEPPMHLECAIFSVKACPFLIQKEMDRRENALPGESVEPAGQMIMRNPGVMLLWITRGFEVQQCYGEHPGFLFTVGNPVDVQWWRQGRQATRAEVLDSIDSGLPALMAPAQAQGQRAVAALLKMKEEAMTLLPRQ